MRSAPVMAAGRLPTNWPCVRYSILAANTHCHGRVDYVSLAVGVTWAFAAGDAPAAALAGRRRTAYLDPAHRSVAEFVVEPPDQHGRDDPQLSGPGGRVGPNRELAVSEAIGAGMRGQVLADDVRPAAEHRAHRRLPLPAAPLEQPANGAQQRLRILPAGTSASRSGPSRWIILAGHGV